MVRQGDEPVVSNSNPNKRDLKVRKGKSKKNEDGATIIPFPKP